MDAPDGTEKETNEIVDKPVDIGADDSPPIKSAPESTCCVWTCPLIMLFFAVAMWLFFGDFEFIYNVEKFEGLYHDKDITYIPISIHMATAVVCLFTGPIQLILGWLGKGRLPWHRWQGRLYVLCMVISIPMAYTCCVITQNGNWQRYSLLLLAFYWTTTLIPAVYFVKKGLVSMTLRVIFAMYDCITLQLFLTRNLFMNSLQMTTIICSGNTKLHREWMMRNYAGTFAFVTFRVGLIIGGTTHGPLPLVGILINMVVVEFIIRGYCKNCFTK